MRAARIGSIVFTFGFAVSASGCELAVRLDRSNADLGADAGCTLCTFEDGGDDGGDDAGLDTNVDGGPDATLDATTSTFDGGTDAP